MMIHDVHVGVQRNKKRTRVGRGTGSGHGKTCGKGHKGHSSRSGFHMHPAFEGGQMPLIRRIPKRGFNNRFAPAVHIVNVGDLEEVFTHGEEVTLDTLRGKNLARGRFDVLKILGDGDLTKRLKVSAHRFSQSAREKIQKAGGEAIELPGKRPVGKQRKAAEAKQGGPPKA
jgi:large subunit ribosomal protein L15